MFGVARLNKQTYLKDSVGCQPKREKTLVVKVYWEIQNIHLEFSPKFLVQLFEKILT